MTKPTVLILGARSDIAMACARRFAAAGHPLVLAARRCAELQADCADLQLRYGQSVRLCAFDVLDPAAHAALLDSLQPLPEITLCAIGLLGDQTAAQQDRHLAERILRSNFEGPAQILGEIANRYAAARQGTLIAISSVAGERGRASNYLYGAAKAGLTAYLSGLRNRLAPLGVRVITVLPGFVDTKMTAGLNLPKKLTATPDEVADAIYRAQSKGRDVIWVRRIWWLIMAIIRNIPESLFKRLKL